MRSAGKAYLSTKNVNADISNHNKTQLAAQRPEKLKNIVEIYVCTVQSCIGNQNMLVHLQTQ